LTIAEGIIVLVVRAIGSVH